MKRFITMMLVAWAMVSTAFAQRFSDKLDRGLVATIAANGQGNFVSWRKFGEEYYDVTYNLYANGALLASGLKQTNFLHSTGNSSTSYQVSAVVRGVEGEKCAAVKRWTEYFYDNGVTRRNTGYLRITGPVAYDRAGNDIRSQYEYNDAVPADVTGDGVPELIVKRNFTGGTLRETSNTTAFNRIEVLTLKGELLWWIDLGPNMMAGPDEQWDAIAFDWDMDGKAEVLMRGADNIIIHHADGSTTTVGDTPNYDARKVYNTQYTCVGAEYLLYMNGETGELYPIGEGGKKWMTYPLKRFESNEFTGTDGTPAYEEAYVKVWGGASNGKHDGGHRSMKHYFGAPYLDGHKPSIFLGRGCYTQHKMTAFDVDPATHKLTQLWYWNNNAGWSNPWFGNGYHNFAIADVDMDGRDEIMFGSMTIDDNGKGLSTTGLGHGDAQHCGDLDPYRWGLEQFACNEDEPNMNYRNATTSQMYYRSQGTADDGRALMGNFTNSYPGCIGRSVNSGMISSVADKVISNLNNAIDWGDLNFRIYWDGDLCEEILNSPGTAKSPKIDKVGTGRIFLGIGNMNNDSKNNPCLSADILGDWREEIVIRSGQDMVIFTTNWPSDYSIYTLWHDHQYRQGMVWQTIGYNQPVHTSFFLGEMEGITMAPPPLMTTEREIVGNGGSIGASLNDKHVLLCETGDMNVSVDEGANPYILTVNASSWVQGTNSSSTTNPTIKYEKSQVTLTGGAFSGGMRLVKQGEGTLVMPAVEQKYTGNTDVWNGILKFDGKLKNSALWLNRFAQLHTNGGEFRSIKMDYASKLLPGGEDQIGTVTVDTLNLGFGARLVLDVNADGTADKLNAKCVTIETKNWQFGPEFLAPVVEVVPHFAAGETKMTEGEYLLAEFDNVAEGSVDNLVLKGTVSTQKSVLELRDNKLYLVVSGVRDNATIAWFGEESALWNASVDENFLMADEASTIFVNGDNVLFNDDAEKFAVEISGEVLPDTVFVDNDSKAYTFKGTGAIGGEAVLYKSGAGKLTITNDNTYTGGNHLTEGTTVVSSLSNATQAYGNLGGVVRNSNNFTIENGAVLQTTAEVTNGSVMKMVGEEGGVLNTGANFTQNMALYGTQLTKRGNGSLRLTTANNSLNKLVVAQGNVSMITDNSLSPAKTLEFQGGSFSDFNGNGSYSNYTYNVNVVEGKTGTWNLDARATYNNKLTGAGTLTVNVQTTIQRTQLQGNWSAFEGTIKATTSSNAVFPFDNAYGIPKATLDLSSGITVGNTAKTFKIGKVTGSGNLGGTIGFGNSVSGSNTWQVGNEDNFTWSGAVTGTGTNFTKLGTGKMTATGAWTTTGAVRVNEGEIHINSNTCLGTGALTVAAGASLTGVTGSLYSSPGNLTNSAYTINGTLQVGIGPSSSSGFMGFGGKNVTMGTNSVLRLGVSRCANGTSSNGGACLTNIGNMTMNGTVSVFLGDSYSLVEGDSVILWTAEKNLGAPKLENYIIDEAAGLYWNDSQLARGVLYVTKEIPAGIHGIYYTNDEDAPIYTLDGVKVAEAGADLKTLEPGIYLRNGKKFVWKKRK